jgi:hypothetical protein
MLALLQAERVLTRVCESLTVSHLGSDVHARHAVAAAWVAEAAREWVDTEGRPDKRLALGALLVRPALEIMAPEQEASSAAADMKARHSWSRLVCQVLLS